MLFGQDRDQLRQFYCQSWRARLEGKPLDPLQSEIVSVVEQHPEYQGLLENPDKALGRDYLPESGETNPFLHMGMHIAIHEQISTNRPDGIRDSYQRLLPQFADAHALEHKLMECLAEMIWRAQKDGTAPDEAAYLACVNRVRPDR